MLHDHVETPNSRYLILYHFISTWNQVTVYTLQYLTVLHQELSHPGLNAWKITTGRATTWNVVGALFCYVCYVLHLFFLSSQSIDHTPQLILHLHM